MQSNDWVPYPLLQDKYAFCLPSNAPNGMASPARRVGRLEANLETETTLALKARL